MKRVLVYVDAENISVSQFLEVKEEINALQDCCVVGKFYGNPKMLGDIMCECYCAGYDFVDTSGISHSTKNVTDMKIAVDCITDVMHVFVNAVDVVYIVSADHDFLPLIYKLMGRGLVIKTPFLQDVVKHKTCTDVSKFLENEGFAESVCDKVCNNLMSMYLEATKNTFPYKLITAYVEKKKAKYVKHVLSVYGDVVGSRVDMIPTDKFGFSEVLEALRLQDMPACVDALDDYTRKIFGISLTKADAMMQISRLYSEEN